MSQTRVGRPQNLFVFLAVLVLSTSWKYVDAQPAPGDRAMKTNKKEPLDNSKASSAPPLDKTVVSNQDDDESTVNRRRHRKVLMPPLRKIVAATALVVLPLAIVPAIWSLILAVVPLPDRW